MSKYSSKPVTVSRPAQEIYDKFNDLTVFGSQLDRLPQEQRAQVGDVKFEHDSISINTPQIGELKFVVTERVCPSRVVFGTSSSPVPLTMRIDIAPVSDHSAEVTTVIDVEIPAMLRPFVGPKLQQAAEKFGELISNLSK